MYEQVIWVPTWGELFHIHWPSSEASRQLQGSRRCRRHERVKRPRNRCVKKLDVKATAGWDCSHDLTGNLKTLTMSTLMVEMGNIIISLTSQRVSLAQWISQIGHELIWIIPNFTGWIFNFSSSVSSAVPIHCSLRSWRTSYSRCSSDVMFNGFDQLFKWVNKIVWNRYIGRVSEDISTYFNLCRLCTAFKFKYVGGSMCNQIGPIPIGVWFSSPGMLFSPTSCWGINEFTVGLGSFENQISVGNGSW